MLGAPEEANNRNSSDYTYRGTPCSLSKSGKMLHDLNSYFVCSRVNSTTFVIREDDKYEEHPFIYTKIYHDVVILIDTGCGGVEQGSSARNLKEFLETQAIAANHDLPINPRKKNGKPSKSYVILCSHCHYDHTLGLQQFEDSGAEIIASKEGKPFIDHDLAEHSLCKFLNIPVPRYKVTHWASDGTQLPCSDAKLDILCIHTPGHTPDSMSFYDRNERHLYVGDSFYERVAKDGIYEQAILFPKEGNIIDYMRSLRKLHQFTKNKNSDEGFVNEPVKISCGHVSTGILGSDVLDAVRRLFVDIIDGKVPITHRQEKRGETFVTFREKGDPRFSVAAPERLVSDAKNKRSDWE